MEQKKSHNITPDAGEVKSSGLRPESDRVKEEERQRAITSPDRGMPRKKGRKKGPLSVGVSFDKSQG